MSVRKRKKHHRAETHEAYMRRMRAWVIQMIEECATEAAQCGRSPEADSGQLFRVPEDNLHSRCGNAIGRSIEHAARPLVPRDIDLPLQ